MLGSFSPSFLVSSLMSLLMTPPFISSLGCYLIPSLFPFEVSRKYTAEFSLDFLLEFPRKIPSGFPCLFTRKFPCISSTHSKFYSARVNECM